jgi:hypothetical protein
MKNEKWKMRNGKSMFLLGAVYLGGLDPLACPQLYFAFSPAFKLASLSLNCGRSVRLYPLADGWTLRAFK